MRPLSILIIGDHDSEYAPHPATREAVISAAAARHLHANTRWMGADDLALYPDAALEAAGVLLPPPGPRTPPLLPLPVLDLLRQCRERGIPSLALGESHAFMLIEFARNVLGLTDADSTLYDEHARHALITDNGSRAVRSHGIEPALRELTLQAAPGCEAALELTLTHEWTNCTHGLSSDYAESFERVGFRAVLQDSEGRPALHRLDGHTCMLACTWLPFHDHQPLKPHPLVQHWLASAATRA